MKKIFFLIPLLFFSNFVHAKEMHHGDDHPQIFHAFTLETEIGEAQDSRGTAFNLHGWIGGDYNRLWLKSEQENFDKNEKKSEIQALYSRNIAQFWDAQAGVRHDFRNGHSDEQLSYFTLSLQGLAPYMFETNAQIFLSENGNLSARLEQELDIFLTQKLITQPYFKAELFAQDVPELEIKSGLSEIEVGIATRYEISQKLAPYFALRYETKTFGTADLAQENGDGVDNFITSIGLRLRF